VIQFRELTLIKPHIRRVLAPTGDHGLRFPIYLFIFLRGGGIDLKRREPRKRLYPGKNNIVLIKEVAKKCTTLLVDSAARFARVSYFINQKTRKFQRNKSQKRNGYKVLRNVIHCVYKCGFEGFEDRKEQSCYTLKVSGGRTSRKRW